MIDFLANTVGKWQLKKQVKKMQRIPESLNFSEMKKGVLVFTLSSEENYENVLKVANNLKRDEGFEVVNLIAFCSEKEVPHFIEDQLVQCVLKQDIGLSGVPKPHVLKSISKTKYDLMLDFSTVIDMPTEFVLALINAKTKAGKTTQEQEYIYDLIIDVKGDTSVLDLSKEMIRYLKMIHN